MFLQKMTVKILETERRIEYDFQCKVDFYTDVMLALWPKICPTGNIKPHKFLTLSEIMVEDDTTAVKICTTNLIDSFIYESLNLRFTRI
jgi:hypothetical protein